ncbi:hypothetical protein [Cryptosporidium parvum Iowa II]|uniref:Uncharacterized protein n=2 Tax=Cryptosporidium parvum TaxID=5807 RepID=Q5CRX6_CRYPI|nr:hypothetical protein [Cryptosporidium parvum Iowa II]EAK88131.1 hypothetical protein cgd5_1090 [Cryptosporidium parvum Iowa II]QOY41544.1 Uncharacterized protein CPATCC_0022900 [Cryptosporidium parvum]WKS77764.1 hypothetical protein CPCDC_5g1090 [Cryptosporidium sp. 43IA8]WRK32255.1 Uncharacterized protein cpbgf_5001090 [Cryptosporidium parvum]|eukprot:QOY41544.1 hypothetical protein CPATCC_002112 [Cryptosporidium parvum]
MAILFLSSFSSCKSNEIDHKKGNISNLIFPFLKIYKKSFLNIVNINDLRNSKSVLNVYCENKNNDIYFIIKLLKYVYIKEKNIHKKKWISNQLKKIMFYKEYNNESSSSLQSKIFNERSEIAENHLLNWRFDIMPMHKVIIPKRNSISRNHLAFPITQERKFVPFNSRLGINQLYLPKLCSNGFLKDIIKINDIKNDCRNNYCVWNPGKLLLSKSSKILAQKTITNNLIFMKPIITGIKREDYIGSKKAFSINLTNSEIPIIPTIPSSNPTNYKSRVAFSAQKKSRSIPIQIKKAANIFPEDSVGNTEWNKYSDGRNRIRSGNAKETNAKYPQYDINCQNEGIFGKDIRERVRLKGPLGYKRLIGNKVQEL